MSDQFLYTTLLDPRARPLIEALSHEYEARYAESSLEAGEVREMQKYPPEIFAPPEGNFLLLLREGEAVAGGAFKRYDAQTAEFKRIWTRDDLRRQGLARRLLAELESQALRQGYRRIYLTTGNRQPEAVGLYLSHGYRKLFDHSIDPNVRCSLPFEKPLAAIPDRAVTLTPLPPTSPWHLPE